MARSGIALSLAVLLAVFEIGSCLRCYQCNSQSDRDCMDPFIPSGRYLVDCATQDSVNYNRAYLRDVLPNQLLDVVAGAPRYCTKIVLQSGTTVRTCLEANPLDVDQTCRALDRTTNDFSSGSTRQLKHCSVCEKEACNSAHSLSVPIATFIASYLISRQL